MLLTLEVAVANTTADTAERVIEVWSEKPLKPWPELAKVRGPRIVLAKLIRGRDIDEVQDYLRNATPWAGMGSDWAGHRGDYDFTTITLVAILHRFGDRPDRLKPETANHLVEVLLPCVGGPGDTMVPNSMGLVRDTENHILMTEISRYLTNQWRFTHQDVGDPRFDNQANGLHDWLVKHLDDLLANGLYEFNSVPYEAYTLQALMTLEAYVDSPALADRARRILDRIVWGAALSSDGLRRVGPFRRQMRYLGDTRLNLHAVNAMAAVWGDWGDEGRRSSDRVIAAALPYRPPDAVLAWLRAKPHDYFVKIGNGPVASPELVSGGSGYVLVAGGAGRGLAARVVPRPTVLLVPDGAEDMTDCFHLPGLEGPMTWNNTGVHRRLACGPAGVHIPQGQVPVAQTANWRAYETAGPRVAVHEQPGLGLLLVLPGGGDAAGWLQKLEAANPDPAMLRSDYRWPDGRAVRYEPHAPAGHWVIQAVDGVPVDRDYDSWDRQPDVPMPAKRDREE